jgi:hypothetical protein
LQGYEMPDDMDSSNSDKEEDARKKGGIYADVDLNRPLEPHENLPVQQHRIVAAPKKEDAPSPSKREGKHRSSKHRDSKERKSRHRYAPTGPPS